MNKIYVITTSRSDYGCLKYVMDEMEKQGVSYDHLDYEWVQAQPIEQSLLELSRWFYAEIIDMGIKNIFILGDRWETLQIALIAKLSNINIFHQGGGEVSNGSYDNYFRRAISQMSDYHFVIDQKCLQRLHDQGIHYRVYNCGSPRLDNDKSKLKKINYIKKTGLVIYHPTTMEDNTYQEITELIDSLRYFDMDYIILHPNNDKGSDIIVEEIREFALNDNVRIEESVSLEDFHNILNSVDVMIGNSSAGVIETASYNLPTVNIGLRQLDRDCNDNVIHCRCEKHEIIKAIDTALSDTFKEKCNEVVNKFGDGHASEKIVNFVKEIL
jgi:UDP-hydrolysing UDP-N-acetyl-D-glucosamine 2-epimerase